MSKGVTFARGFSAAVAAAGVKHGVPERDDVAVIASDAPCSAAGLFTTNQVIAAPCVITRRHLATGKLRAIVANSGNANACTGEQGEHDAMAMARAAAALVGASPYEVAVASTGVIGVPLPVDRITTAVAGMKLSPDAGEAVARAIMTTDTKPKLSQRAVSLARGMVRLGGVAKGAGMIHPQMATLLAFVTSDADVDAATLRAALEAAADRTFNAISVDGDTSTNDTLLVVANGASGVTVSGPDVPAFTDALTTLCAELAQQVVADGEGVTRVFEVRLRGALSDADAKLAARTITASNLVKTAVHGADPNWGRILAAAGRSGARVDQSRASVRIGDQVVYADGVPRRFDADAVRRAFGAPRVPIEVDLGLGTGESRAWGTDLSAEYVRINADYTT